MAKVTTAKKGPSLFDLTEELRGLMGAMEEWAESHEGDVSEFPLDRLGKLEGDVKDKVLKCASMIKEEKRLALSIKGMEKGLADRRKAHDAHVERFEAYVESCLPDNAKYEDDFVSVAWKKNPAAVDVLVDAAVLPEKYLKRPKPEPDLTALKADMVSFDVPIVDDEGKPILGEDESPVTRPELQVRWPVPTGEKRSLPSVDGTEPVEVDVTEEKVVARMAQGKSLQIK